MALRLRRGLESNRLSITPADGEPIYTTDGKKLYIGDGSTAGGIAVDTNIADGDKGDITVSSSGSVWTIDNGAIGTAKLGGDITTAGKALLDDADASAQRTTLGLGTIATQNATALTGSFNFEGFALKQETTGFALQINAAGDDYTASQVLDIVTNNASRQLTLAGNLTVSADATVSGTNSGDQNTFATIAVSGQSNVVADSTADTLTIAAGSGISITTNATTDTLTISATGGGITGSGAANKVAFWSGTSALSSNSNFHWDNTNSRLGIKSTSPNTSLAVAGGAHVTKELACGLFNWEGDSKEGRIMMSGSTAEFSIFDRGLTAVGTAAGDRFTLYNSSKIFRIYTDSNNDIFTMSNTGSIGLGLGGFGGTASARIHARSTTEQLRLDFNASNYCSFTVADGGAITLDAVGTGTPKFIFSDAVEVPDSAYSSGWNGSTAVPTRNAVYDKMQDVALAAITFIIDGGGSAISTGVKGDLEIPFACTIEEVTVLADQTGSIVVDIWRDSYANFPPTVADTITASAKPTLSSANKTQNATLTGWTTSLNAGDILRFNVDSAATVQRVSIILQVRK
jgi:hypothetical protein